MSPGVERQYFKLKFIDSDRLFKRLNRIQRVLLHIENNLAEQWYLKEEQAILIILTERNEVQLKNN